jgi:hypothetical protein
MNATVSRSPIAARWFGSRGLRWLGGDTQLIRSVKVFVVVWQRLCEEHSSLPQIYPDSQPSGQNGDDRQQDRVCRAKVWRVGHADAQFAGDQK